MSNNQTIKQRIKDALTEAGKSVNSIARGDATVQRRLNRHINEAQSPSWETLELVSKETGVTIDYLVLGGNQRKRVDAPLVPLVPDVAYAGGLGGYADGSKLADCELVQSEFGGATLAIRVLGDSMEPRIPSGAIIFADKIEDPQNIPYGHVAVVDTVDGVLLKELHPHRDGLLLHSFNPRYPDRIIPSADIRAIFRALGYKYTSNL